MENTHIYFMTQGIQYTSYTTHTLHPSHVARSSERKKHDFIVLHTDVAAYIRPTYEIGQTCYGKCLKVSFCDVMITHLGGYKSYHTG